MFACHKKGETQPQFSNGLQEQMTMLKLKKKGSSVFCDVDTNNSRLVLGLESLPLQQDKVEREFDLTVY